MPLTRREERALRLQRAASRLCSPLWIPLLDLILVGLMRWRIEGRDELRRLYAELRRSRAPLLVCANHLTKLDSFAIARGLGSAGFFLRDFGALPWNAPERTLFAASPWQRALAWLFKCVPVRRGGSRREVAGAIEKLRFLMQRGEAVLLFPEGGRSRSSRVEVESAAYGVGRLVGALPGCRVLCVYLRGRGQESWSDAPRRGERFALAACVIEPKTEQRGLRASLDLSRQIVTQLAELERRTLDARE